GTRKSSPPQMSMGWRWCSPGRGCSGTSLVVRGALVRAGTAVRCQQVKETAGSGSRVSVVDNGVAQPRFSKSQRWDRVVYELTLNPDPGFTRRLTPNVCARPGPNQRSLSKHFASLRRLYCTTRSP